MNWGFSVIRRMGGRLSLDQWSLTLCMVILLGGGGQWLLGRREEPWTLLPALILFALAWGLSIARAPADPAWKRLPAALGPSREAWLLLAIMAVAVFFRIHRLDSVPANLYIECANVGLGGLRILHEGWRPFYETWFFEHPALMLYLSALWFKFFAPTQENLGLFYVTHALAAFPFIYWTFRQLAGPRAALLTLFILAVMRPHLFYSRWGHSMIQPPLYLFATLAFGLFAWHTGKRWAFWAAALSFSLGAYTYQSFKVVPLLLLACLVFEHRRDPERFRRLLPALGTALALTLFLTSPLLWHWVEQGTLGHRESGLFIGRAILEEGGLRVFFRNLADFSLQFNREGPADALANLPGQRWFDDMTGVLWLLGLGLALRYFRDRVSFYVLAALGILSLPDLLTVDPLHMGRTLPLLPFLAFLASVPLLEAGGSIRRMGSATGRWILWGALGLVLGTMAWQNYSLYFHRQAKDPAHLSKNDPIPSRLAKEIADKGDREPFYLCARYSDHNTVRFLNYFHPDRTRPLGFPGDPLPDLPAPGKKAVHILLDEGKSGFLRFLQAAYPGSQAVTWGSSDDGTRAYDLRVPAEALDPPRRRTSARGLLARYWSSSAFPERILERWEPLVNFTFWGDFPMQEKLLRAEWRGCFKAERQGTYRFFILQHPGEEAWLQVDGRRVEGAGAGREGVLSLQAGWHGLVLSFRRKESFFSALSLLWRPPGRERYEVMPNDVFGEGPSMSGKGCP